MGKLVSPTVLVVDDEMRFGIGFKRALLDRGAIGSVVVDNIPDAVRLLLDSSIHFDALLADLYFETGEDAQRELFDGLDLIEFAAKHRPEIDSYAVSAHADAYLYKRKLVERRIPAKHLFDKRTFGLLDEDGDVTGADQPWNVVRLDVYRRRIAQDPSLESRVDEHFGEGADSRQLLGDILASVAAPTVTYIERLDPPLVARCPIEVLCTPMSDGTVCASAPHLGLLVDAFGDTGSGAVDALRDLISSHAIELLSDDEFTGYAAALRSHLSAHIELADHADES